MTRRAKAFTVIELLVVVSVIAILLAVLLPTTRYIRETARRTRCTHNLTQIFAAMMVYADDYRDHLPDCTVLNVRPTHPDFPRQLHNLLRPYIEGADTDLTEPIDLFICPSASNAEEDLLRIFGATYQVRSDYGYGGTWNQFPFNGRLVDYYPRPGELGLIRDARGWHRLSRRGGWGLRSTMGQQVLFLDGHVEYFGDVDRHAGGIW